MNSVWIFFRSHWWGVCLLHRALCPIQYRLIKQPFTQDSHPLLKSLYVCVCWCMTLFVFSFTCMHPFLCAVNSQKDFCLFNYCGAGTGTGILMQPDPPVNTWKFISTDFTDSRADAPSLALSCFYQPVTFWWHYPTSLALSVFRVKS